MDWENVFQYVAKDIPATVDDITYLQKSVLAPLTKSEIVEINSQQQNPFSVSDPLHEKYQTIDPSKWDIPMRQFPDAFVAFLEWSNGGNFLRGEREFNMFCTKSIRGYLLAYQIPAYMPGAVPFAFDGGREFYLFDMREEMNDGEYPILMAHSESLGWDQDDAIRIADTFIEAITES
ncbi:MAG: SMI1/KNR4 family protein [Gimesia sp.]|uniref:SMI1/KNR4 family protein n=1 Tax=Gimesia sp. TaxID=2024833 RepID=UPI000C5B52E6|nr:SMI1/KNR4 family protein [Gimesia sp.]MAX35765.1 SMI1/KNR4 family protein [Gimesia sp.]|tara:strand:- start:1351 stop:1881 length:531 start_codon:yes stop_codon:yes gene_type:complete